MTPAIVRATSNSGVHEVNAGRLLVATPATVDPNFARSVVLVLEHSQAGSLGLVLNQPTELAVDDVLPRWSAAVSPPATVFRGGPVEQQAALCLGRWRSVPAGDEPPSWRQVVGRLGTIDLDADPEALEPHLDAVRLFAGYSGWAPGQLDGEIEAGGWFVVDAVEDDPFGADSEELWRRVLGRQRGRVAWVANFPADPAMN